MVLVTTRFSVFRKLLGHQISYVHHVKEHDETTFFPESHYNLTLSFAFVFWPGTGSNFLPVSVWIFLPVSVWILLRIIESFGVGLWYVVSKYWAAWWSLFYRSYIDRYLFHCSGTKLLSPFIDGPETPDITYLSIGK